MVSLGQSDGIRPQAEPVHSKVTVENGGGVQGDPEQANLSDNRVVIPTLDIPLDGNLGHQPPVANERANFENFYNWLFQSVMPKLEECILQGPYPQDTSKVDELRSLLNSRPSLKEELSENIQLFEHFGIARHLDMSRAERREVENLRTKGLLVLRTVDSLAEHARKPDGLTNYTAHSAVNLIIPELPRAAASLSFSLENQKAALDHCKLLLSHLCMFRKCFETGVNVRNVCLDHSPPALGAPFVTLAISAGLIYAGYGIYSLGKIIAASTNNGNWLIGAGLSGVAFSVVTCVLVAKAIYKPVLKTF